MGVQHGEAVRTLYMLERRNHSSFQRVTRRRLDEVRERFGVRVGVKPVTLALQRRAQRVGVFDDAVVHQRDPAMAVAVGMRVPLRGCSVGGPARVRNAGAAVQRQPSDVLGQRLDAARELAGDDASSRLDRHALEPAEAFQQDRRRVALADVAHDAAHTLTCPPRLARAAVWASLPARTGPTRTTCPASVP